VSRGDRVVLETAGGAGYGDPRERSPEALAADLANRKVGVTAARDIYAGNHGGST
jgi:N-methylhydantoinase B